MELTQHSADDPALADVLALIRTSFAYMDGVVDPPSSVHRMTLDSLRGNADRAEVWSIGPPLQACIILTPKPATLYVGKLCVAASAQGRGLSRRLMTHAATRAKALDLPSLTLETRVELTANHAIFKAMGFVETGKTAHDGYAKPTSVRFEKLLSNK